MGSQPELAARPRSGFDDGARDLAIRPRLQLERQALAGEGFLEALDDGIDRGVVPEVLCA